jgi:3-oxoacyl-[acyl-carrier-protein] synthase II
MTHRVVVTGMGAVSPLGDTVRQNWFSILAGKSGIRTINRFCVANYHSKIAGMVPDHVLQHPSISDKDRRRFDVFIQYACIAADEAAADAQLQNLPHRHRLGVAIGSGIGGLSKIEDTHTVLLEKGPSKIQPFFIPGSLVNLAAGLVSIRHHLKGPNMAIVSACTTSAHNIGIAYDTIRLNRADIMVCGGAEMALCPLGLSGFSAMKSLSTRNDAPEQASRPWDRARDGFVLAEGAAILVLESFEHARQRGATIYGEIIGFGMSGDAYHVSSPDPDGSGFVQCMSEALKDACISPEAIQYINAHATSTQMGDTLELAAIGQVFGHRSSLAISSTKSMTGHLLGATGALEAIFTLLALRDGVIPPTINLDEPDSLCHAFNMVPHVAQEQALHFALSNSFGFGGTNASLVFKKFS